MTVARRTHMDDLSFEQLDAIVLAKDPDLGHTEVGFGRESMTDGRSAHGDLAPCDLDTTSYGATRDRSMSGSATVDRTGAMTTSCGAPSSTCAMSGSSIVRPSTRIRTGGIQRARVLHVDRVKAAAEAVFEGDRGPRDRHARLEPETVALAGEAEDVLEGDAVEPAG